MLGSECTVAETCSCSQRAEVHPAIRSLVAVTVAGACHVTAASVTWPQPHSRDRRSSADYLLIACQVLTRTSGTLPQHLVCLLSSGHVTCNPALPLVDSWSRDLAICALIGPGFPHSRCLWLSFPYSKLLFAVLLCFVIFLLCPLFISSWVVVLWWCLGNTSNC